MLDSSAFKDLAASARKELSDCLGVCDDETESTQWVIVETFAKQMQRIVYSFVGKDLAEKTRLEMKTKRLEGQLIELNAQFYREVTQLKLAVNNNRGTRNNESVDDMPEFYAPLSFLPDEIRDMCMKLIREKADAAVRALQQESGGPDVDKMEQDMQELRKQVAELAEARRQIEGYKDSAARCDADLRSLEEQLERAKAELADAQRESENLSRRNEELLVSCSDSSEAEALRAELGAKDAALAALQEELRQLRDEIETLRAAVTIPEEAPPVVVEERSPEVSIAEVEARVEADLRRRLSEELIAAANEDFAEEREKLKKRIRELEEELKAALEAVPAPVEFVPNEEDKAALAAEIAKRAEIERELEAEKKKNEALRLTEEELLASVEEWREKSNAFEQEVLDLKKTEAKLFTVIDELRDKLEKVLAQASKMGGETGEVLSDMLANIGLDDFLKHACNKKVFDRLYNDALRRVRVCAEKHTEKWLELGMSNPTFVDHMTETLRETMWKTDKPQMFDMDRMLAGNNAVRTAQAIEKAREVGPEGHTNHFFTSNKSTMRQLSPWRGRSPVRYMSPRAEVPEGLTCNVSAIIVDETSCSPKKGRSPKKKLKGGGYKVAEETAWHCVRDEQSAVIFEDIPFIGEDDKTREAGGSAAPKEFTTSRRSSLSLKRTSSKVGSGKLGDTKGVRLPIMQGQQNSGMRKVVSEPHFGHMTMPINAL